MPTAYLRYAKKIIIFHEQSCTYDLRLQQKWVNTISGEEKWEWVEIFEG